MTLQDLYPLIKHAHFVVIEDGYQIIQSYDAHKYMLREIEEIAGGRDQTIVIYLGRKF